MQKLSVCVAVAENNSMITPKFIKDNALAIIAAIAAYGALVYKIDDVRERVVRLENVVIGKTSVVSHQKIQTPEVFYE